MNRKGQALVEFIIVLPVLIFILLAIIDFGTLSFNKNKLENIITDVSSMYKNNESIEDINKFLNKNDKDIKLEITNEDKYTNIKLYKSYDYITPGMDKIFKNKSIVVERTVYNE